MLSIDLHVIIRAQAAAATAEAATLFTCTFEAASEALAALPRMLIEPDGSFVWVASSEPGWQLDGVLYDGAAVLWYVELKGRAPEEAFDRLLEALGWPKTPLVFELVREGVVLDEAAFRRRAGWVV